MTLVSKETRCSWCDKMHIDAINEDGFCQEKTEGLAKHRKKMNEFSLSDIEKQALSDAGIKTKEYWAIVLIPNGTPIAMFDSKGHAEIWKNDNWRTALIESYILQIK